MPTTHRFPMPQIGPSGPMRKPVWLKVKAPCGDGFGHVKAILNDTKLSTVCQEARCPNMGECWASGTATVMLMGEVCTRACRFCNVKTGAPDPLDPGEPERLALAVRALNLKYLVLTSVDRDDLPDGGASHFANAISAIRLESPSTRIEVLIPDFNGSKPSLDLLAKARPDVIGHNLETVASLQSRIRDRRASYDQSLSLLGYVKSEHKTPTKSSLMLGMGETKPEILQCLTDLRSVGVDLLTMGQYLQPSQFHLKVERFYTPEEFDWLRDQALTMGFRFVAAGPLVRSSYRAFESTSVLHPSRD